MGGRPCGGRTVTHLRHIGLVDRLRWFHRCYTCLQSRVTVTHARKIQPVGWGALGSVWSSAAEQARAIG